MAEETKGDGSPPQGSGHGSTRSGSTSGEGAPVGFDADSAPRESQLRVMTSRQLLEKARVAISHDNSTILEQCLRALVLRSTHVQQACDHLRSLHEEDKQQLRASLSGNGPPIAATPNVLAKSDLLGEDGPEHSLESAHGRLELADGVVFQSLYSVERAKMSSNPEDGDATLLRRLALDHSLLHHALLHRASKCVRTLFKFYPTTRKSESETGLVITVCCTNVADSAEAVSMAMEWDNPEVFETLLKSKQGFRVVDLDADVPHVYELIHTINGSEHGLELGSGVPNVYPVHYCAMHSKNRVLQKLIDEGADIDVPNAEGEYPLHLAFQCGNKVGSEMLINAGADVRQKNQRGQTALHYLYLEVEKKARDQKVLKARVKEIKHTGHRISEVTQQLQASQVDASEDAALDSKKRNQELKHAKRELAMYTKEIKELHVVADLAIRNGADIDARDDNNVTPMTQAVMDNWYESQSKALQKEVWNNVHDGWKSHLFKDPRTQRTVDHLWATNVRGKLYFNLCIWGIYLLFVMMVAVWQTGRDSFMTRTFQASFEETILFDEYGAHHSGFWDMRNEAEMYEWLNEILTPNLYENRGLLRQTAVNASTQTHLKGSIAHFNHLVGRPRIRTIRTKSRSCTGTGDEMSGFGTATCFWGVNRDGIEARNFTTGNVLWEYRSSDVPRFQGLIDSYPGSGHSIVLPADQAKWADILSQMQNNAFVDMHTRLVIVELCLFNPNHNLFLTARLGVEFTTTGAVVPVAVVDTLKLIHFLDGSDFARLPIELITFILLLLYIYKEIRDLCTEWPRQLDEDGQVIPTPTLHLYVPVLGEHSILKTCCCCFSSRKKPVIPAVALPREQEDHKRGKLPPLNTGGKKASKGGSIGPKKLTLMHRIRRQRKRARRAASAATASITSDAFQRTTNFLCMNSISIRRIDTHINYRPYFVNSFNLVDVLLVSVFAAWFGTFIHALILADGINWGQHDQFVNVYDLAALVRQKVYLMASTAFLVWMKSLEFLRVNRSLSTFILVIKGMLAKITSFFVVLAVCLIAFATLDYVAFYNQSDSRATVLLSILNGFGGSMDGVDLMQHFHMARYIAPLFSMSFAVFVIILLFNLLIAVMSEGYEDIKEAASAAWCFTQFQMYDRHMKRKAELKGKSFMRRYCGFCMCYCPCCGRKQRKDDVAAKPAPPAPSSQPAAAKPSQPPPVPVPV